jgi:hypothetical protein
MKAIKKAVCITGTYTDRTTGAEKKQYLTVGKLFARDDGSMCLKMDAVPVGFDGWVNFYDLEQAGAERPTSGGMVQKPAQPDPSDPNDDIPF